MFRRHIHICCALGLATIVLLAKSGLDAAALIAPGPGLTTGSEKHLGLISETGCFLMDREDPRHGFFTNAKHEKEELFSVYFKQAANSYNARKVKLTGELIEDGGHRYVTTATITKDLGACANEHPGLEAAVQSGDVVGSGSTVSTPPNTEIGCLHIDPINPVHGWITNAKYRGEPLVVYFKSSAKSYENRVVRVTGRWTTKQVPPNPEEEKWGVVSRSMEELTDATIDRELGACSGGESSHPELVK
jgi:hypothetical protein